MKTIIKFSTILFSFFALGGCTLERVSYEEIYPENFFQNEDDVQKAISGLYYPFKTGYGHFYGADQYGYFIVSDYTTGMLDTKTENVGWNYNHYWEHRWRENGSDRGTEFCDKIYPKYNELSRIQSTIRNIREAPVSDDLKRRAEAEAKCLYGWLGFIMYDIFGPVPLITEEAMDHREDEIFIPRLSDVEYTRVMIDNLDYAIEYLPEVQTSWGHVTKGMALMLKLKFLMMNRNFAEAEPVARQLQDMGKRGVYELIENDYASVFAKSNAKNKEIIHAIPCGTTINPNRWLTQVMRGDVPGFTGSGWGTFCMSWAFYDSFDPDDDRLKTIIAEYTSTTTGLLVKRGAGNLARGPFPRKIGDDPSQVGEIGTTDHIVYRYADVLLSLAECINENKGGPDTEAIALVNRIRTRVGLPDLTLAQTAGKTAFNAAILNERKHEFYCEGLSRQDEIRHGVFVSNSLAKYPDSQSAEYKVRFPIPFNYITESEGVVDQNLGY